MYLLAGAAVREHRVRRHGLAVVGLEGGHAQLEVGPVLVLPPAHGRGVGEVDEQRLLGVLDGFGRAGVRVAREVAVRLALAGHLAVVVDVGNLPEAELEAALAEPIDEAWWVGEGLLIPFEVAAVEPLVFAALKPERIKVDDIAGNVQFAQALDDALDLLAVAVHAARPPDAERPAWGHRRPSGELGVARDDLFARGAIDEEVIEVGVSDADGGRLEGGVSELVSELRMVVEEEAEATAADEERDVDVAGGRGYRAHGVAAPGDDALALAIEGAEVLAEAVEVVIRVQREHFMKLDAPVRTTRIAGRQSYGAADLAVVPSLLEDGAAVFGSDGERPFGFVQKHSDRFTVDLDPVAPVRDLYAMRSVGASYEYR